MEGPGAPSSRTRSAGREQQGATHPAEAGSRSEGPSQLSGPGTPGPEHLLEGRQAERIQSLRAQRLKLHPRLRAALLLTAAVLGGAGVVVGSSALAMPRFRLIAIPQLHYDQFDPLWEYSGTVMSCTFCHVNKEGGAPWNPFGQALQHGFQANPKASFGDVLYAVLAANGDSDGDGYPDAIEVFAHTLPGDPASHPDKPLAELEQEFAAAGGVAMYAPKGKK